MSREEQIEYIQRLWEFVAPRPEELAIPAWQIDLADERWQEYERDPSKASAWSEVKQRLLEKHVPSDS